MSNVECPPEFRAATSIGLSIFPTDTFALICGRIFAGPEHTAFCAGGHRRYQDKGKNIGDGFRGNRRENPGRIHVLHS
ncbi:hypothetical protein PO591_20400 [Escherichia coli]|uniref:hypothetical protein n=1 Tax=Escherichia coli TaxID=562 RepID=UPI00259C9D46|nr:hypothetical protein [Escherichia coli]MDM4819696.1 hypothetical protein [Escherichia coli]MDM4847670.1 hypothetical protein [Escherichia coli]